MFALMDRVRDWLNGSSTTAGPELQAIEGPRDAVVVIDVSASMDTDDYKPTRLHAAKSAALAYAEQLAEFEEAARLAVVTYSSGAEVELDLTPVTNLPAIRKKIASLSSRSSTNLKAGLRAARCMLERHGSRQGQVIVQSDGHSNTGGNPVGEAARLKSIAIVECVGIGGSPSDVDEDLLKQVASTNSDGSTRYRWIGDGLQLVQHYRKLAGRLSRI